VGPRRSSRPHRLPTGKVSNFAECEAGGGGVYNKKTEGATITFGVGWSGTVSGNTPDDIFNV
jgi:hypothetical protein